MLSLGVVLLFTVKDLELFIFVLNSNKMISALEHLYFHRSLRNSLY